jgi:flagellar motility protein MotE (MotC chaperone)
MIKRLRLIDAVAIAAVALLALKGLDYLRRDGADAGLPAAAPSLQAAGEAGGISGFARVLAHARSGYTPRPDTPLPDVTETGSTGEGDDAPPVDALAPREQSSSPAEAAIRERLEQRRQNLEHRGADIELREEMIRQAEERLEERLRKLREAEDGGRSAEADARREQEMANLVAMYQAMRPKEAARIFDRLDLDILVPVVLEMNPRTMAEIMAAMSAESAERLTVALARRAQGDALQTRNASARPTSSGGRELPALELPQRN